MVEALGNFFAAIATALLGKKRKKNNKDWLKSLFFR